MTVPPSPRMAWFIAARWVVELAGQLAAGRRARRWSSTSGCRSSARSRSSRSVSPMSAPLVSQLLGQARRAAGGESVSPCSSRSTIAWCRLRRRDSAPWLPALTSSASLRKSSSTCAFDRLGGQLSRRRGDRLDRLALGDHAPAGAPRPRSARRAALTGRTSASTMRRVERGAAGRHLADARRRAGRPRPTWSLSR